MSAAVKSTVTISLTAVVVLVAAQGKEFFASLMAGWEFLLLVVGKTPLGLASFLLACVMGTVVMGALRRWLPEMQSRDRMHWRMAFIELASAAAAFFTLWYQTKTMLGMMLAVVAGLSISIIYRIVAAIGGLVMRKLSDERQPTEP